LCMAADRKKESSFHLGNWSEAERLQACKLYMKSGDDGHEHHWQQSP